MDSTNSVATAMLNLRRRMRKRSSNAITRGIAIVALVFVVIDVAVAFEVYGAIQSTGSVSTFPRSSSRSSSMITTTESSISSAADTTFFNTATSIDTSTASSIATTVSSTTSIMQSSSSASSPTTTTTTSLALTSSQSGTTATTANVSQACYASSSSSSSSTSTQTPALGQPIPDSLYAALSSGVSCSTLALVGSGSGVTLPQTIKNGSSLTQNGKPEILYIGAEYCPYCAAERWPVIVALSKFGTFTQLSYMLSSSNDIYPNTPTFSFYGSSYTSQYISFVGVEVEDRSMHYLQGLDPNQTAIFNKYDPHQQIPFLDIANQYLVISSQYTPSTLPENGDWNQIASQLNDSSSPIAQSVDAAANTLISAICKIDGGKPADLCGQSFAKLTLPSDALSPKNAAASTLGGTTTSTPIYPRKRTYSVVVTN